MWTPVYARGLHAGAWLCRNARGRDGGVREEVGGGNQRRGASRAGNSATVASPGPAPKTIIALSSGWLAIRPRWIVHRCYSGPWRPRRGRHHRRSPARAFRDVARSGRSPPPRFRTIQVCPKDLESLPGHPKPAVSWHSGFRGGAHARLKATPVSHAARRRGACMATCHEGYSCGACSLRSKRRKLLSANGRRRAQKILKSLSA
jgi:hypothetical protein